MVKANINTVKGLQNVFEPCLALMLSSFNSQTYHILFLLSCILDEMDGLRLVAKHYPLHQIDEFTAWFPWKFCIIILEWAILKLSVLK